MAQCHCTDFVLVSAPMPGGSQSSVLFSSIEYNASDLRDYLCSHTHIHIKTHTQLSLLKVIKTREMKIWQWQGKQCSSLRVSTVVYQTIWTLKKLPVRLEVSRISNSRSDLNSGSRGSFRPVWSIYQAGDQVWGQPGYIVKTLTQKQKLKKKLPVII